MDQIRADAIRRIREWRADPVKFVRDNFQVEPDTWQVKVLRCLPGDPSKSSQAIRVAMQACAGPGKSAVLAWAGWYILSCYAKPGEHPKGSAVSITADNLKDNLWPEFAKWRARSAYLSAAFEWLKERIFAKDHPETWFLSARSFPKSANPDEIGRTISGLHSAYPFVLLDESGGIHPAIGRAAEQAMGNCTIGWILQAGNPFSLDGYLYLCATKLRDQWIVIPITGDPDDPDRSPRIDIEWARQQIAAYGRDNPWVMAYILGKFPPSSINALLGPDDCSAAAARKFRDDQISWAAKILGYDAARFGDDRNVLIPRQGLWCGAPVVMRNARTQDVGGRIVEMHRNWRWDACFADAAMSDDVAYYCSELNYHIQQIHFGGSAKDDTRFHNKRAEMMWTAAEFVKAGGGLPDDPELMAEACAHTYTFDKRGRILVVEKDQVKKLIGRSPDKWDAYILTHADQVHIEQRDHRGLPIVEEIGHAIVDDGRYGL
jgi:phage terminase large subunit